MATEKLTETGGNQDACRGEDADNANRTPNVHASIYRGIQSRRLDYAADQVRRPHQTPTGLLTPS